MVDKVGKVKVGEIHNILIEILACKHGKFNIRFSYKGNDILIW